MSSSTKTISKKLKIFLHIPYWVFLALFIISISVSVYALRNNNKTMIGLRTAVYEADKNNSDVNLALNNLRRYVYGHMNTNLASGGNAIKPPIQLKYTYERLQASAQKGIDDVNSKVYNDAQNFCQQQNSTDISGRNRVPCVQDYVTAHGVANANAIPAALYKYDFISPTWSSDLAGWSLVVAVFLFLAFLASFTLDKLVKSRLKEL
jgi:hypothetical protein